MKHISLVIFEEVLMSCLSGVMDLLDSANELVRKSGKPIPFRIQLVAADGAEVRVSQHVRFSCDKTISDLRSTDLVIIPSFTGEAVQMLKKYSLLLIWLTKMKARGAEVAGLCTSSYFLAEAGLLDGRNATSHWQIVDEMQRKYPGVQFMPDKVITDCDGVYTSGSASFALNLIIYLVEKFCGRDISIQLSKQYAIDMDRSAQNYFAVFQGQRQHEDDAILRAQIFMEENYHSAITIEQITEQVNMSRRNFIRRFKQATGSNPIEYLRRLKIEAAKKALENGKDDIYSIMFDVGYNDVKAFRSSFRRTTGLSPAGYQKKYSRKEH